MRRSKHFKWHSAVNNVLAELCGWLLIVVTALIVLDLVSRDIAKPLYSLSILAMFTMIAVVYMGMPTSEEGNAHIRVELLFDKLSDSSSRLLYLATDLLSIITLIFVLWAVSQNALAAFEDSQAVPGPVPVLTYPIKFLMFFSLLMYEIQICINFYNRFRKLLTLKG
jgi:TRAP-type C4-dicarboxylate transport system permease small subunit